MTVKFLGPEALVAAMVAKLQAEMPTRIAAINAEKADDVTVAVPSDDRYFTSALRTIAPGSPAVLVMDGPMSLSSGGEGPHSLLTVTQIAVWVMDEDSDEDRLGRRLQRLSRAAVESLWDGTPQEQLANSDGSQLAYNLRPHSTVPGRPFEPDQGGSNLREFYLTIFSATRLEGS